MKQISSTESKLLKSYLLKASNYIRQLEEKYDEEMITIDNDTAQTIEDYLVSIVYVVNNSKDVCYD